MMRIRVVETGEELDYGLSAVLEDPSEMKCLAIAFLLPHRLSGLGGTDAMAAVRSSMAGRRSLFSSILNMRTSLTEPANQAN